MELYNYFRSSASYRVRIGLALKGLDYDYRSVHLPKNEQTAESYASVSASRLVPLLKDGDKLTIDANTGEISPAVTEAEFAARLDRLAQDLRGTTVHEELDR